MTMPDQGQIEVDWRVRARDPQEVRDVAAALACTNEHVYNLIISGEIYAIDISSPAARRPCYRIPRREVLRFLEVHGTLDSQCRQDRRGQNTQL